MIYKCLGFAHFCQKDPIRHSPSGFLLRVPLPNDGFKIGPSYLRCLPENASTSSNPPKFKYGRMFAKKKTQDRARVRVTSLRSAL